MASADPWDTEAAWRPWNLCVSVDEPTRYGYRRRHLTTPGLALIWETFDAPCRLRGMATPDGIVLVLPLRVGPRSRYWGMPITPDRLPTTRCVGIDWTVERGQGHMLLIVAPSLIHKHLESDLHGPLERAARTYSVPVKADALESLGPRLLDLIEQVRRPAETWSPTAIAALEQEALRQLAEMIDVPRLRKCKRRFPTRRAAIERALAYLRVASLPEVKLPELAEAACASARTLEYGFQNMFDLTPLGFLQLMRLHAVRRELIAGGTDDRTVREIANQWGFHQHGRFSGYYQKAFGELPSETRARQARQADRQTASRSGLGTECAARPGTRMGDPADDRCPA